MSMGAIIEGVGVVVYLYLVWRNLRGNYVSDGLVGYGWWSAMAWLVGGRLGWGLANWGETGGNWWIWLEFWKYPGMNYMVAYLCWFLVTWWWVGRVDWKMWSFLEDTLVAVLILGAFGVVGFASRLGWSWNEVIYLSIIVVGGVLGMWLKVRYRSFFWYKSGKKGFVFLASNLVIFLMLGIYWLVAGKIVFGGGAVILSLISGGGLVMLGKA